MSRRRRIRGGRRADTGAERSHRFRDVGQAPMHVAEDRDPGACELALQLGLRVVHDDEIGLERKNALDAGIQEPADAREPLDLRREPVVGSDTGQPIAGAHGEQHFCRCRE